MGQLPNLILAANPMQEGQIKGGTYSDIAHMAYRVDPGPRLMRLSQTLPGQGGLLYFSPEPGQSGGQTGFFLQQVVRECAARGDRGVIADLPQGCGELAGQLDRALTQRKLGLYVPEQYHSQAPNARLLFPTAISGGSLRERLREVVKTYGAERVVPALERSAEDFIPPARGGGGRKLSDQELADLRRRLRPSVFWSPELCARYFTYSGAGGRVHFVLFDDAETLRSKLRLAGELGVRECLAAWADLYPPSQGAG